MGGDAILVEMRGEQYALHPVWRVEVPVVEAFVPIVNHKQRRPSLDGKIHRTIAQKHLSLLPRIPTSLLATYHRVRLPIFTLSSDKCIFLTT
ncbi:hypothetical protein HBI39_190100 [Parastagonospora nodorum]|nr:hypothetical protein HBI39_190100 [Parastagonospora nodorum]